MSNKIRHTTCPILIGKNMIIGQATYCIFENLRFLPTSMTNPAWI